MNLYDFDKTIYKKDSTIEFYKFCCRKNKKILKCLFTQMWAMFMYLIGFYDKTKMKEKFYCFLKYLDNINVLVEEFWNIEEKNINEWIYEKKSEGDYVISASPKFLLQPICEKLNIKLIASEVNPKDGKYTGKNCYGKEKVERLKELSINSVKEAYSDSLSDLPMLKLAKDSYIVKDRKIIKLEDYKPSLINKLKHQFISKSFVQFLMVGLLNAINGIVFSSIFSFFLQTNIAFICGYIIAMTIAYVINSLWIFNKKLNLKKYGLFCVSYIPNFLIQNIIVLIMYNILNINKIVTFTTSVIVAVPITFLCVKFLCFIKGDSNEKD